MKLLSRREFLKKCGLITGTSFLVSQFSSVYSLFAKETQIPHIIQVTGPNPEKNIKQALAQLGGIEQFVSRGDIVAIKPNISWARAPEFAANTDPQVVATVVKLCLEAGAKAVKITDNSCNDPRSCFNLSGIEKAVQLSGGKIFFTQDYMFKEMNIDGEYLKKFKVNREFIEADVLINLPVAKHHSLAQLTIGMKNWIGALGGSRWKVHQNINQSIADLAYFFKPDLTIVDCTRILLRHGPSGGNLSDVKETKTIIASRDPVAADSLACQLFSKVPEDIPYISIAAKMGLGTNNLKNTSVKKVLL
ncbi:DUF362 domain-containing protein [Chlamydiota bacterium]